MKTKRIAGIALSLVLVFFLGVTTVMAASPHFIKATASINNAGALVFKWKEAGLASIQGIDYTASAEASAVWGCVTKGDKAPNDPKKMTVSSPFYTGAHFAAGKNGQITAQLSFPAPPPTSGFSCPRGQYIALIEITYSSITLIDTTNGINAPVPASVTRIFIDYP